MQETKECRCCGREFFKRKRDSQKQWEERNFCSISCKNKSVEPTPIHIRFWNFVDKKRDNDCWLWLGSKDENGYGRLATQQGESAIKAHRLSAGKRGYLGAAIERNKV